MGLFLAADCQTRQKEDRRKQENILMKRVKSFVNVSLTCHSVQPVSVLSRSQPDKHHLLPEMTDPRKGEHEVPPT